MPSYQKKVQVPGQSAQQLYEFISKEIDRFLEKASLGKYELEKDGSNRVIRVKSTYFTGALSCMEGALELQGNLSLLATPFRSKLDDGIEKWISKNFS